VALVPRLPERVVALIGVSDVAEAAELLARLRREAPSLESADFFLDDGLQLVLDHLRLPAPIEPRPPVYLIVELAGRGDVMEELAEALGDTDAVVGADGADRDRLWRLRESHTEAIAAAGVPHKLDVGVPPASLAGFLDAVRATVAEAGARVVLFGHLGDGNVHVNVLGAEGDAIDEVVLRLVAERGGTISAEHGVGVAKARWLALTRSEAEIAAMRAVKHALDPQGILNPGAVLA
jgi:FAD/FMN-containing dehydrogenase